MWTLGTILAILLCAATVKLFMIWYTAKQKEADNQYQSAWELLKKWQKARPFLKIAACPYSRMLVCEMIDAHTKLLKMGASSDVEHLEYLKQLLTQGPSPYDPVTFDSAYAESIYYS